MSEQQARMLRTKMLGALIRKTRQDSGQSIDETANAVGLNPSVLEEFESGKRGISLPDLELLCFHYNIDVEDILASKSSPKKAAPEIKPDVQRPLRQRIIAAQLRKLRQEKLDEIQAVADAVEISPDALEDYERGKNPIPLPELEALSEYYSTPLENFMAHEGPLARKTQEPAMDTSLELPEDLLAFVRQPENLPYLRLAAALRQMPEKELRQFAQSLLGEDS